MANAHEGGALGSELALGNAFSNRQGRFSISGLRAGSLYLFRAGFGAGLGNPVGSAQLVSVVEGKTVILVLRTAGGFSARLRASGDEGLPRYVSVMVRQTGPPLEDGSDYGTSEYHDHSPSRISFTGISPGTYTVTICSYRHLPETIENVRIRPGKMTNLGEIELDAGAALVVSLRCADGSSLGRNTILAIRRDGKMVRTRTGPRGRVRIPLPPGEYGVVLDRGEVATTLLGWIRVEQGGCVRLEGVVPVAGDLRIVVQDAEGRPRPSIRVEVLSTEPEPLAHLLPSRLRRDIMWEWVAVQPRRIWKIRDWQTDANGTVEVTSLSPGDYIIRVGESRTRATVRTAEVEVVEVTTP
jgi:hypothetical protein